MQAASAESPKESRMKVAVTAVVLLVLLLSRGGCEVRRPGGRREEPEGQTEMWGSKGGRGGSAVQGNPFGRKGRQRCEEGTLGGKHLWGGGLSCDGEPWGVAPVSVTQGGDPFVGVTSASLGGRGGSLGGTNTRRNHLWGGTFRRCLCCEGGTQQCNACLCLGNPFVGTPVGVGTICGGNLW